MALALLAAGLALMTVTADSRHDAELSLPVQGEQLHEIPNQEEEAMQQESSNRQEGTDPQTALPVPEGAQINELTLADFPAPVQGPQLRAVGSYYFEDIQDNLFHSGTDYIQAEGAIITATRGGTVIYAGVDPFLGQKVEIDCGGGWFVTYGCLDNLRVKVGDKVERQAVLGQVALDGGPDAVSGQTQLHYEVRYGDEVME